MFCTSCGSHIPDDAKFCIKCGNPIAQEAFPATIQQPAAQSVAPRPTDQSGPHASPSTHVGSTVPIGIPMAAAPAAFGAIPQETASSSLSGNNLGKGNRKGPMKGILIAVCVVIVVALCAIIGTVIWTASENESVEKRDESVQALAEQLYSSAEDIVPDTGKGAKRATLLKQYSELVATREGLETAEQNGNFDLADGAKLDISSYLTSIDSKIAQIRDWFSSNYSSTLKKDKISSKATSKNTSIKKCNKKLKALKNLKKLIQDEKEIWGGDTGKGSKYANLVSKVDKQIARANSLLKKIKAYQKAKRAKARKARLSRASQLSEDEKFKAFLGNWTVQSGSGGNWNFQTLTFKYDGSGYETSRMYRKNFFWWRTSTLANGDVIVKLRFTDSDFVITYYYNLNSKTFRSSDGTVYRHSA